MTTATEKPGADWFAIITRPDLASFSEAFTRDVVLEISAADQPIIGTAAIRSFFDATRSLYDRITFVHETKGVRRTILEWEGAFEGRDVGGTTILITNAAGIIERIRLYHRPYGQVVAFAAELTRRLDTTSQL